MTEHIERRGTQYERPANSGTGPAEVDRPDVTETSVGEIFAEISRDFSTLMRQELTLAKAEVREEAVKGGKAAGMLGGSALAGYFTLLFASAALWWGLANVMDEGWAALIVAGVWAVIAAVLYVLGRSRLREVRPTPERTAETLKEVPRALKPNGGANDH